MIAGFFFLETSQHRIFLYLSMLCGIVCIYKNNAWEIFKNKDALWLVTAAFLGFIALSLLWSQGMDAERIWQKLKPALFIVITMATAIFLLRQNDKNWAKAQEIFVTSALLSALILLVLNANEIISAYLLNETGRIWRLEGMGRAINENLAGLLYGIAALLSLFIKGDLIKLYASKKIRISVFLLLSLILFLTISRGAMLSYLAVSCILILLSITKSIQMEKMRKVAVLSLIGALGVVVIFTYVLPDVADYMIQRGSTGRLQIWEIAWGHACQSPLYGQGIGTKYTYEVYDKMHIVVGHAHNLYLSTFLQTGIIGLSLFLIIIISCLQKSYRLARENDMAPVIMVSFGLVFGIVDFGGYYTNLGVTWIVFWLPLAYIIHKRSQKNT